MKNLIRSVLDEFHHIDAEGHVSPRCDAEELKRRKAKRSEPHPAQIQRQTSSTNSRSSSLDTLPSDASVGRYVRPLDLTSVNSRSDSDDGAVAADRRSPSRQRSCSSVQQSTIVSVASGSQESSLGSLPSPRRYNLISRSNSTQRSARSANPTVRGRRRRPEEHNEVVPEPISRRTSTRTRTSTRDRDFIYWFLMSRNVFYIDLNE